MKYGIFYPFWEQKWGTDYHPYIDKMNRLGFDILEISAVGLGEMSDDELKALKDHGDEKNVTFKIENNNLICSNGETFTVWLIKNFSL